MVLLRQPILQMVQTVGVFMYQGIYCSYPAEFPGDDDLEADRILVDPAKPTEAFHALLGHGDDFQLNPQRELAPEPSQCFVEFLPIARWHERNTSL